MKRMLADVLWEAANVRLLTKVDWHPTKSYYTCDAVMVACSVVGWYTAAEFLRSLGCPGGTECFKQFSDEMERQGVRYMWLLLAMHVAEDEGITV